MYQNIVYPWIKRDNFLTNYDILSPFVLFNM